MKKCWQVKGSAEQDVLSALLKNRGIVGEAEITSFLNPDWDRDIIDPHEFTQMKAAVERIFQALENNEKIIIHGDYDADGVCGSVLLSSCLRQIAQKMEVEINLDAYLPDREKDGYGVAEHNVKAFADQGVALLITVDCGIANADELAQAHKSGLDVIICDHHQLAEKIPHPAIIIHPLAPNETYANKHLAGTGVAFKLACALIKGAQDRGLDFPVGYEKWFLDLVAIATVTDIMPLTGENRILEKYGLIVLNKTRRPGLQKLIEISRSELGQIDTETIGFRIGPRLNAAGRLRSAKIAYEALCAADDDSADQKAQELEIINRERRQVSDAAYQAAKKMISQDQEDRMIKVVWSEDWSPGVIGLVAGKIVSDFNAPAFVFTQVGEHLVGSGRSMGGLHLVEAMRSCGDIFIKSGGHPQACGLTIESEEKLRIFKEKVEAFAQDFFQSEQPEPIIEIDFDLKLSQINQALIDQIQQLAPFGQGNPEPIFLLSGVKVLKVDAVGRDRKHLKLLVGDGQNQLPCIGFNFGQEAQKILLGSSLDLVIKLRINEWNGQKNIQGQVVDLDLTTALD